MSKAKRRELAASVVEHLAEDYPEAECALNHDGPFQLLAATILSAQCTDARVNMVTPDLFRRWPDPAALSAAEADDVEGVIRSTGFFRNKTKSLIGMARGIVENHDGCVPDDIEALVALPGVARKTANVVLGTAFGRAAGVVVDTHVHRISYRLGLCRHHDPNKVELELMSLLPREEWTNFSHRLIHHGRRICDARRPRCDGCSMRALCPSRQDVPSPRRLPVKKTITTPRRKRARAVSGRTAAGGKS